MPQFPSLPETAHLSDVLIRFPRHIQPLMELTNAILRTDSALSIGQEELIAAYVSGLNACDFCYKSHVVYAEAFGIDEGLVQDLLDNPEQAAATPAMLALLAYVKKLNTLTSKLTPSDSKQVFDAGWSEEALFEAVEVTGLFNMFNRLIEGAGVNFDFDQNSDAHLAATRTPKGHEASYSIFAKRLLAQTAQE